ncbi:hypothetical protein OS035_24325 [Rhizobium sp. 268]|uniref:hypothetical protein n=1 Tax=Rhizobium sp. 268 TaxID=2996375 RepID=UPI002F94C91E
MQYDVRVVPQFAESDFIARYQDDKRRAAQEQHRSRQKRREADARRRAARKAAGVEVHWLDEQEAQHWADVSRYEHELDLERINNGYVRVGGGKKISGYELAPRVSEKGLRSRTFTGNKFMELFPSWLPKRGKIRANWGKTVLLTHTSKVRALDLPAVEGRRDSLGFLRWDTDFVWPSVEAAKAAFLKLRDKGIPIPHVLTGLLLPTGEYVRPHALRGLPYGQSVMADPTAKGFRKAPLKLYKDVYLGMCEAMLEVGCDPGAPATTMQTKNPLSPELHTVILQDDDWRPLREIAPCLKRGLRRDLLIREAAAVQSNLSIQASNEIFETYRRAALECLRIWMWSGDLAYTEAMSSPDRGALHDHVHQHLQSIAVSAEIDTDLTAIQAKVAQYAADNWDPSKSSSKRKGEGALLHVVTGMTRKDSQAAGGRYSAEMKKHAAMEKIRAALETMATSGDEPPSVRRLAKAAGVSPDTVQSRKSEVAEVVASLWVEGVRNRSNVKKDQTYPVGEGEEEATAAGKAPCVRDTSSVDEALSHQYPLRTQIGSVDDDGLPSQRDVSEFIFDPDAEQDED